MAAAELFDTHCHIQSAGQVSGERLTHEKWSKYADLTGETLLQRAREDGVTRAVCVGCDLEDSELAVDFVQGKEQVWASIGLHPHEAQNYVDQPVLLDRFAALAERDKVVAVGECGLDYFYEHSPKAAQLEILAWQLALAKTHDLPVIFHVREAFDDFWPVFDRYPGLRGVLHSFTDDQTNLSKAVERGLYIGVNGIATFAKSDEQRAMYRAIPLEKLVLETDAPFLTPVPYRGSINEPKFTRVVSNFVADLRGENPEIIAAQTTQNALRLFGLS